MARADFHDTAKALSLVALSVLLLPVSLAVLAVGHLSHLISRSPPRSPKDPLTDPGPRRTVLVTGVGMAKGLTLARAFHAAGHRVLGADVEAGGVPCAGRFSRSLAAFYQLPSPGGDGGAAAYTARLVDIARAAGVDLWVSCSGVASAAEDAAARTALEDTTRCRCVQFGAAATARLHEKDAFAAAVAAVGLLGPETHAVASAGALLALLDAARHRAPVRRFLLKPVGVDDAHRGDLTLLPRPTRAETEAHVRARLPSREDDDDFPAGGPPGWIVQQFVPGGAEYCSHALVVRGEVRCFVACPSAELLMHYEALPADSALSRAMLAFTREFVARSRAADPEEAWTGHLSFDFMVADGDDDDGTAVDAAGFRRRLYAIECNPRAHTAVVLFAEDATTTQAMVQAYLSVLDDDDDENHYEPRETNGEPPAPPVVTPPARAVPRYWVGHDLAALVLQPVGAWAMGRAATRDLLFGFAAFATHVLTWQEGTWTPADPLPALVLYHVYWPLTILKAWWDGRRWSRVNVSTTKMFMC